MLPWTGTPPPVRRLSQLPCFNKHYPLIWLALYGLLGSISCDPGPDAQRPAAAPDAALPPGPGTDAVSSLALPANARRAGEALTHPAAVRATELVNSAVVENRLEGFAEAEAVIREALDTKPEQAELYEALGGLTVERHLHLSQRGMSPGEELEHALQHYQRALRLEPGRRTTRLAQARLYEIQARPDRAMAIYDEMLAVEPEDPWLLMSKGGVLMTQQRYAEAIPALQASADRYRELGDDYTVALLLGMLGRCHVRLGQDERAEEVLLSSVEQLQALSPQPGQAPVACPYTALGQLYRRAGEDARGVELFVEAADFERHRPDTQYEAAAYFYATGDLDRAQHYIARAIELGDDPSFRELEAQIQAALDAGVAGGAPLLPLAGDEPDAQDPVLTAALEAFRLQAYSEAEGLLEPSVDADSSVRAVVVKSWILLLDKRYDDAEALLARVEAKGTEPDAVHVTRAHLALARKDYPAAERHLDQVPLLRGNGASNTWSQAVERMGCLASGWSLANQHRHRDAIGWFERILRADNDDRFALLGKGNAHNALGEHDQAAVCFERVLERHPDDPYALAELGLVALNMGDDQAAEALFLQAREASPQAYTCPHEGLGMVYLRQGKQAQARQAFEQAIAINPDIEFQKYNGLARIHMAEGRLDEAEALLERSLENYPYENEATELLAELEALRGGRAGP